MQAILWPKNVIVVVDINRNFRENFSPISIKILKIFRR